jgi:hypothetical protein
MRKLFVLASAAAVGVTMSTASVAGAAAAAPGSTAIGPGQSIQYAIDHARPGTTILLRPGIYRQSVTIRTDRITLRGSGDFPGGTVLEPPRSMPQTICNAAFGPTGICLLAKRLNPTTHAVIRTVNNVTVTDLSVVGFAGNGVFGYGTSGMTVTNVAAINNGRYGISRFVSTGTLFADDIAVGSHEAGFYVGDSPDADTVVRDNQAIGNQFGIFVRHAREVQVLGNRVTGNCQGILVLDDGQKGGAGNATIARNTVYRNNKFCPKGGDTPVNTQGGGILLLGATKTVVRENSVGGNAGKQFNAGGIVVLSARSISHGSNPNFDTIKDNTAYGDHPADLIWDGSGRGLRFAHNHCGTSIPGGLCH